jgi:hypothetical protein
MADRPILFSGPMVRALLAGTKTQTRRVLKPMPPPGAASFGTYYNPDPRPHYWAFDGDALMDFAVRCPYGEPGDRLWVRENGWERPERSPKMMREGADTWAPYYFDADGISDCEANDLRAWGFKRRPSIHMPRWASRILLEVTGVRVERLKDISADDCFAEGIELRIETPAKTQYMRLWEQINGAASWSANPWVWVVEFKRVEPTHAN